MGSAFTDEEKRFILSEMIKQSNIDVDMLVEFVRSNTIDPDWHAMHLPVGKSLNQCFAATESMFNAAVSRPSLKRKAFGSPPEQAHKRLATTDLAHATLQPPFAGHLPTLPPLQTNIPMPQPGFGPGTQHVNIQPRPPNMGHAGVSTPIGPPDPGVPRLPPGSRRRGRPSRADQSRHLRPVLPPHLTPIAPRTPIAEDFSRTGSPSTVATASQETPKPAKRRGRPPATDKSKPTNNVGQPLRNLASTPPLGQHDAQPGPATVPVRQPDTPETSSSSLSHSPEKDRHP